eukprot:TRINITY_DN747_c0_g1_i3.p1 TRINITY_DN747_c0_g1~~TRINITY_DN747_c0_g1_i3.p1  ORF type:complete len:1126 (-),score=307.75 TRINITY_DN747_c0_g1_i3:259-3636(-)
MYICPRSPIPLLFCPCSRSLSHFCLPSLPLIAIPWFPSQRTHTNIVPTVYSIKPNTGINYGGEPVTITGRLFGSPTNNSEIVQVQIGGRDATKCKVHSDRNITCLTPPGYGRKQAVQVTIRGDKSPQYELFSYPPARKPDEAVFGVGNSYMNEPQSIYTSRLIQSRTTERKAMDVYADIELRAMEVIKATLSCGVYATGGAVVTVRSDIDRSYTKGSTATIMEPNAIVVAGQKGWGNGVSQGLFRSLDDGKVRVRGYITTTGPSGTFRDCSLVLTKLEPGTYAYGTDDVSERRVSLPNVKTSPLWHALMPKWQSGYSRIPAFHWTYCRFISFPQRWPSSVRESDIQVIASVDHRTYSSYGHDGIGMWIEYITHHGFRACISELGRRDHWHDSHSHMTYVTYIRPSAVAAYDTAFGEIAVPHGARHSWCKTVDYGHKNFIERPTVLASIRHNYRGSGHHDPTQTWVHRADTRTATICFSEHDNRDKWHARLWIQWMALPKKSAQGSCPNNRVLDSGQLSRRIYYTWYYCAWIPFTSNRGQQPVVQITIANRYPHHVVPAEAWVEGIHHHGFYMCAESHRGWHLGDVVINWAAFRQGVMNNGVKGCGYPLSVARQVKRGSHKLTDFSAKVAVQKGDQVYVGLACNTVNLHPGATTYMTIYAKGNADHVVRSDWITNTNYAASYATQITGGFTQGLYKATTDGALTFSGTYHCGSGVGSFEHCSVIAQKLPGAHKANGQWARAGYANTWSSRAIKYFHQAKVTDFSASLEVEAGDVVYAALATNLWCSGQGCMYEEGGNRMALAISPDSSANATTFLASNWATGNYAWDSGASQGVYRAEKDGELKFFGFYYRANIKGGHAITMSYVYSNIIAFKIGTAKYPGAAAIIPEKLKSGLWAFRRAGDYDPVGPGSLIQRNGGLHYVGGYIAKGCWEYRNPSSSRYTRAKSDGVYWISPHGHSAFKVYCDMQTDGGGWTLLDNDATPGAMFHSRTLGAVLDPDHTTKGAYLPSYQYSARPQMLCKSSYYTGNKPWITLNLVGQNARNYATSVASNHWGHNSLYGEFQYGISNGNYQVGLGTWLYRHSGRFGSMWVGHGGQPTCACNYYAPHPHSGLGRWQYSNHNTCSIWVR